MMKHVIFCGVGSLICCAGVAAGVDETPVTLDISRVGASEHVTHIYYNLASGERVVTLAPDSQTSGASGDDSRLIWSTSGAMSCAPGSSSFYFAVDDPGSTSLSTGITILETADVPLDTVVDCVSLSWVTTHADTDSNSDGVGDGVEGLAAQWGYFEPDNGESGNYCNRLPIVYFTLTDLPGSTLGSGLVAGYQIDVDLAGGLDHDLTFEIGDSDGDCQTAANCNSSVFNSSTGDFGPVALGDRDFDSRPDTDLDGDGLYDFSWRVRFIQPGTEDLDGDGQIDGVPAPTDEDMIGLMLGMPKGAIFNSEGDWEGEVDYSVPGAGTGAEDRFVMFLGLDGIRLGSGWFGGHDCDQNPDGTPGFTPAAVFQHAIYGPSGGGGGCRADINGDGQLNFFDVSSFLSQYSAGADYNGDGQADFFDVSSFLSDFNAGCP